MPVLVFYLAKHLRLAEVYFFPILWQVSEYMRVIRSVLVLVIILLPFPTLSAVRKQKYGE